MQSLTLGRKFSGNRTIAERKQSSSCAACGQIGHWKGDDACPVSAKKVNFTDAGKGKGKDKGKDKGKSRFDRSGDAGPRKKVLAVAHADGDYTHHDLPPHQLGSFFNFMTNAHHVHITTAPQDFSMILDTACQRTCCGTGWLASHTKILHHHRLKTKSVETTEMFQFGSGNPMQALHRVYMPSRLGRADVLLGACVSDTEIPLLASNTLLHKLGMVLDLPSMTAHFRHIGMTVKVTSMHGHLCAPIAPQDPQASTSDTWVQLSQPHVWQRPDPELLLPDSMRRILGAVFCLEWNALVMMSRMVTFGLASRSWLTLCEKTEQVATQMRETQPKSSKDCIHPQWKRFGNRYGRYSQSPFSVSSAKPALPLPSSQNISLGHKPKQQALPQSKFRPSQRPSAPSMTSSTCGPEHPLDNLSDMPEDMSLDGTESQAWEYDFPEN